MSSQERRITMKLRHPNPLFEKWLTEWINDAKQRDSKMQHCFTKALQSLQKYPLPLESGRDCKILHGFGDKLCQMLDEKLDQCNAKNQSNLNKTLDYIPENIDRKSRKQTIVSLNPKRNKREYLPTYRSGAYAILVTLYKNSASEIYKFSMKKSEIITKGQCLCDKSFTESGSFYAATKTLIDKQLVLKQGNPPQFSLTTYGFNVAQKLYEKHIINMVESKDKINTQSVKLTIENGGEKNDLKNLNMYVNQNDKASKVLNDKEKNDTVIFTPHTFEILLILDKQETAGAKQKVQNDPILSQISHLNIPYDVKHLKVGDYVWICRNKNTNVELVLPYIIERKRMDDFGSSIKDGRYHEQKFRLKQCGIQNVIYLIESYGDNTHTGLPLSTLYQAATNTLLQEGFTVKFTDGLRGTAQYLNCITRILKENYESKTVVSCSKINLEKFSINDDLISLMTFQEFNQSGSKYKNFTISEMFIKQLVQLKGLSVDKALAIVEKYPTVKLLKMACDEDIEETEKIIANIQFGKKKRIGPVISSMLCKFYTLEQFI